MTVMIRLVCVFELTCAVYSRLVLCIVTHV